MKLWRKAFGLVKDHKSLLLASLSRRTSFRNPEIEAAVIKATSHDEFAMDMKNVDRVFRWLRLSPSHLKCLIMSISLRMEKTKSWVVAIKGLMLMHGVYSSKIPAIQRIGRLPFDLSNFSDGYSDPCKIWGVNEFIRAYFTYLDQKSSLLFMNLQERRNLQNLEHANNNNVVFDGQYSMIQDLILIEKLQYLLDMLLHIRPLCDDAVVPLVLEAMDCVMIEVFDVYSRICNGIARVLLRIYCAGKVEASMALRMVEKAGIQGEELSVYFELCQSIGVKNASEFPRIEQIPYEDIKELEEIIKGVSENDKAIVGDHNVENISRLRTVITDKWEKFHEDDGLKPAPNPFQICTPSKTPELPDLITFL